MLECVLDVILSKFERKTLKHSQVTQKVGHVEDSGYDADKQLWFPKWRSLILTSMSFQMTSSIHNLAKLYFFSFFNVFY